MNTFLLILWLFFFTLHKAYCLRFSYKQLMDQPFSHLKIKSILSYAEIITVIAYMYLLISRNIYWFSVLIAFIALTSRYIVKIFTYSKAIKQMALFQQKANNMPFDEALSVAKIMVNIEIKSGERSS